jgi:hypothetical protein
MTRGRPKDMSQLKPGEIKRFDSSRTISVSYVGGIDYDFQGVIAVVLTEANGLVFEKHDGSFGFIPAGFLFYEIGPENK